MPENKKNLLRTILRQQGCYQTVADLMDACRQIEQDTITTMEKMAWNEIIDCLEDVKLIASERGI